MKYSFFKIKFVNTDSHQTHSKFKNLNMLLFLEFTYLIKKKKKKNTYNREIK